jgi:hypothetical protein
MMQNRSLISAVILLLAMMAWPVAVPAQSLGLAPAQIVQKFKPGVPFQFDLSTINNSDSTVEMHVQITDFWYDEKNEKVFSSPGSSPRSAANWIQFVPERFEVAAHGTQKMSAIVTPPSDARGGYYATLFVVSKRVLSFNDTANDKKVYTEMRIGCLVMLSAENTEEPRIEISNLKLVPPSANQGLRLDFEVANQGNSHFFPLGRLAILNSLHKLMGKAQSEEKRFLPGQKDSMHVDWTGILPPGDYTAVLTVTYAEDRIETRQVPFHISN